MPVLQNLIMYSFCIVDDITQVLIEQRAGKLIALLSPGWMATVLRSLTDSARQYPQSSGH